MIRIMILALYSTLSLQDKASAIDYVNSAGTRDTPNDALHPVKAKGIDLLTRSQAIYICEHCTVPSIRTVEVMSRNHHGCIVGGRRTPDADMDNYLANMERRVKRSWFPPKNCPGELRPPTVWVSIEPHGNISELRLSLPSVSERANQAAVAAITNSAPFGMLPKDWREGVDVEFNFDHSLFTRKRLNGEKSAFRKDKTIFFRDCID